MSNASRKRLIDEIKLLPVEERIQIADSVLKTLNPVDEKTEKKWINVAEERLRELKSGKVKGIPGDGLFEKIQKRFSS